MYEVRVKTIHGSNHNVEFDNLQEAKDKVNEGLKDCFSYKDPEFEQWFYFPAHAIVEMQITKMDENKKGEVSMPDQPKKIFVLTVHLYDGQVIDIITYHYHHEDGQLDKLQKLKTEGFTQLEDGVLVHYPPGSIRKIEQHKGKEKGKK